MPIQVDVPEAPETPDISLEPLIINASEGVTSESPQENQMQTDVLVSENIIPESSVKVPEVSLQCSENISSEMLGSIHLPISVDDDLTEPQALSDSQSGNTDDTVENILQNASVQVKRVCFSDITQHLRNSSDSDARLTTSVESTSSVSEPPVGSRSTDQEVPVTVPTPVPKPKRAQKSVDRVAYMQMLNRSRWLLEVCKKQSEEIARLKSCNQDSSDSEGRSSGQRRLHSGLINPSAGVESGRKLRKKKA